MKDIIFATFNSDLTFQKNERVVAYNWFEKNPPYNFGTYIKKYSTEEDLQDDEFCRRIDTKEMKIFNIGSYKIKSILNNMVRIVEYDRFDEITRKKK